MTTRSSPQLPASLISTKHVAQVHESPGTVNYPASPVLASSELVATLLRLLVLHPFDLKPGITFLHSLPAGSCQWYHQVTIGKMKPVELWTSFCCWITAIIQQCWATAWDLLTHQNVEKIFSKGMAYLSYSPSTGTEPVTVPGPSIQSTIVDPQSQGTTYVT